VSEGKIALEIEGAVEHCFTWYKVFRDLSSSVRPLIAPRDSPGACMLSFRLVSILVPSN
jgi:hypothetical protein